MADVQIYKKKRMLLVIGERLSERAVYCRTINRHIQKFFATDKAAHNGFSLYGSMRREVDERREMDGWPSNVFSTDV